MIALDATSTAPPYEQIRAQFAEQIRNGRLVPGTRLPTVRALATDLGLAVNTVARVYRELETAGLVVTRGRAGTVVSDTDPARAKVTTAAREYATLARGIGLSAQEALALVRTALDT